MMDRVLPKIRFLAIWNQPEKWEFQASFARFFDIIDDFFQSFEVPLAC
jgi:hypothetical protein